MKEDRPRTDAEDFPDWSIEYTDEPTWRVSIFKFIVDHKVKEPKVKFVSEDPHMQYVSTVGFLLSTCSYSIIYRDPLVC